MRTDALRTKPEKRKHKTLFNFIDPEFGIRYRLVNPVRSPR